jgi:hypothetical protein
VSFDQVEQVEEKPLLALPGNVRLLRVLSSLDEVRIFQEKLTTTLLSDVHKRLQKPDRWLLEEAEIES